MKHTLLTLSFLFTCLIGFSQKSELGVHLGIVNYYGDLNPRQFNFESPTFGYGIFYRNHLNLQSAIRASALFSSISVADADFRERAARGFSFTTLFTEISLVLEWHFLAKNPRDEEGNLQKSNSPYLFFGLAGLYSNPQVTGLPDNAPELTADVSKISAVFPFGVGYRWDLDYKTRLGIEYGFRPTFSDYLDGISESANPDKQDWYNYISAQLSYRFGKLK